MKKRGKKELTFKEAKRRCAIITAVVSSVFFVIPTIFKLATSEINEDIMFFSFISLFVIPFSIYCLLDLLYKTPWLKTKEELEKEKKTCQGFLSKEVFTQVTFLPQEKSSESEMCFSILENAGFIFFAKFDNEDNIILIVKDKDNKDIYKQEISNYRYFNLRFKKKEN